MPITPINNLGNLFPVVNYTPLTPLSNFLQKGNLITFNYVNWANDPRPLVILTDVSPGMRIRGINLNYLTFNYIKNILLSNCNNVGFSYSNIKGDAYIVSAFRSYKWQGIQQLRKLDCKFLLSVMSVVRSFDPNEIKMIRQSVREQIQQQISPKAEAGEIPNYGING